VIGKYFKVFLLALALSVIAIVPTVFAEEDSNTDSDETTADSTSPTPKFVRPLLLKDRIQNAREKNKEINENIKERASASAEKRKERLSEARLKVCEARQKNISNRIKNMQTRAQNIHKAHERVYALVDKFYTGKLVPNGYTLSNYEDLKAEVAANKANVTALLESAKTTGGEFDCESEDPKGQADAFHEDMKALVEANKTYKDSIHDFVKAVRDFAKTVKTDKISGTPTPAEAGGEE